MLFSGSRECRTEWALPIMQPSSGGDDKDGKKPKARPAADEPSKKRTIQILDPGLVDDSSRKRAMVIAPNGEFVPAKPKVARGPRKAPAPAPTPMEKKYEGLPMPSRPSPNPAPRPMAPGTDPHFHLPFSRPLPSHFA